MEEPTIREQELLCAMVWGYKAHEKGMNTYEAEIKFLQEYRE